MNINWHRLFGLLLMDYLSARGFSVELEKDLSLKQQYLDVVIIKQENTEDRLKGLGAEDRLKGLRAEERLKGLRAEERLKGLRAEEIEFYLEKLKKGKG